MEGFDRHIMITLEENFYCCVVVDTQLCPNSFSVKVVLEPNKDHNKNYNIALERVSIFFNEVLDDSILIGPESMGKFATPIGLNGTVHALPDEPYDHLLSIALFTKINAIVENTFNVISVSVTSTQGKGVTHTFDDEHYEIGPNILREIVDDPNNDLVDYINYWYETDLTYFKLHPNGLIKETHDWGKFNLALESYENVTELKKFKPRIVKSDNDTDDT